MYLPYTQTVSWQANPEAFSLRECAGEWSGCVCSAARSDQHQPVLRHAEDVPVLLVLRDHGVLPGSVAGARLPVFVVLRYSS